jgi:hypothetical protein
MHAINLFLGIVFLGLGPYDAQDPCSRSEASAVAEQYATQIIQRYTISIPVDYTVKLTSYNCRGENWLIRMEVRWTDLESQALQSINGELRIIEAEWSFTEIQSDVNQQPSAPGSDANAFSHVGMLDTLASVNQAQLLNLTPQLVSFELRSPNQPQWQSYRLGPFAENELRWEHWAEQYLLRLNGTIYQIKPGGKYKLATLPDGKLELFKLDPQSTYLINNTNDPLALEILAGVEGASRGQTALRNHQFVMYPIFQEDSVLRFRIPGSAEVYTAEKGRTYVFQKDAKGTVRFRPLP